jgi:hypothetical protein
MSLRSPVFVAVLAASACNTGGPANRVTMATPAPTPTPAAAPTPVVARTACGVGAGTGGSEQSCPRTSAAFLREVDVAINRVVARHPELFDLDRVHGPGGFFVKDVDEYYRRVVQELGEGAGLCAIVDGGGEIAVKSNNDFSDQYHIMISAGHIRRGVASYRATCSPAWF